MNDKDIRLSNGELLNVNVNFYTLKLISDLDIEKLQTKMEKAKTEEQKNKIGMDITGKMIYVILRSNGKMVNEEEAMMLIPIDPTEINNLFSEFGRKVEAFKKKEEFKRQVTS